MKASRTLALAFVLALVTVVPYVQVRQHDFVNYADDLYITGNTTVQTGLTAESVRWALTATDAASWHPVTWWSHMLDVQLYGLRPVGHHLTNVALHALATALLFLVLARLTAAPWRSAFVAALFGLHPLNVEVVAWVAERRTILSVLFGLLAMWTYAGWVARGGVGRYLLVVFWFATSLMAKPVLVTLPFVLLLLDLWPLGRFGATGGQPAAGVPRLVLEKVPLFALAAASSAVTFVVQSRAGGVLARPLPDRVANTLVSYVQYLRTVLWPFELGVFYPLPAAWPAVMVAGAATLLLAITGVTIAAWRRRPHVAVGWLWYLGTLVPMIGLVHLGEQARADRYTYFPAIGLFVMLVWSIPDRPRVPAVRAAVAMAILGGLGVLTWTQVGYWRNSRTLFEHALAVSPDASPAHDHLGMALADQGDIDAAIKHYQEAIRLDPRAARAYGNLGVAHANRGKIDEAIKDYEQALAIRPGWSVLHANLASAYTQQNQLDRATDQLREAVRLESTVPEYHYNLAVVYAQQDKHDEAAAAFREALRLRPRYPDALIGLGDTAKAQGKSGEAVAAYRAAVELAPNDAVVRNNLAWMLLVKPDRSASDLQEAVVLLERACELTKDQDAKMLDTLATAHALSRNFDKAQEIGESALARARVSEPPEVAGEIQRHLDRFQELRAAASPKQGT